MNNSVTHASCFARRCIYFAGWTLIASASVCLTTISSPFLTSLTSSRLYRLSKSRFFAAGRAKSPCDFCNRYPRRALSFRQYRRQHHRALSRSGKLNSAPSLGEWRLVRLAHVNRRCTIIFRRHVIAGFDLFEVLCFRADFQRNHISPWAF